MNSPGLKIAELRQFIGLSIQDVADAVQLTEKDLFEVESGRLIPNAPQLLTFAALFSVDINILTNGKTMDEDVLTMVSLFPKAELGESDDAEVKKFAQYLRNTAPRMAS